MLQTQTAKTASFTTGALVGVLVHYVWENVIYLIYNYNSVSVRPTTVPRLNGPAEPSEQSDSSAF